MQAAGEARQRGLASGSGLHRLKRGPLSGCVRVAILCAALEGRVVVVHRHRFDLNDTESVMMRYDQYLCVQKAAVGAHAVQVLDRHKPNSCPLVSDVTLGRSLTLQNSFNVAPS